MKIKRKFQRIRYYCSWKYPTLYSYFHKISFAVQLGVLCLVLMGAVNLYKQHFSWDAASSRLRNSAMLANTTNPEKDTNIINAAMESPSTKSKQVSATPTIEKAPIDEFEQYMLLRAAASGQQNAETPKAIERPTASQPNTEASLTTAPPKPTSISATMVKTAALPVVPVNECQAQEKLLDTDKALRAEVAKAEALLATKRQQAELLEGKIKTAKALLQSSNTLTAKSEAPSDAVYGDMWLVSQAPRSYIIQLASSNDYNALLSYAQELPSDTIAIYPYKIGVNGNITYGLSTGLYNSDKQALSALSDLPNVAKQNSPWVRKIADVNAQVFAVRRINKKHQ